MNPRTLPRVGLGFVVLFLAGVALANGTIGVIGLLGLACSYLVANRLGHVCTCDDPLPGAYALYTPATPAARCPYHHAR